MNKKDLSRKLAHKTFCRLKPSAISGVGVFAIREIPKGVNPFQDCRQARLIAFREKELAMFAPGVKKLIKDFCIVKNSLYLVPHFGLNCIDLAYYLNHSKNPNMRAMVQSKSGDVEFITRRRINNGEELTVDYKTYSEK